MAHVQPSIVAWGSKEELKQLKSWFYDPQPPVNPGEEPLDLRQRAIRRVQAYQTRSTNIPPEIIATTLLTQALLIPSDSPSLVFRTSMTLALIRFVNSLLDPLQKRDKSLPLTVLATTAGLPRVFVEIRHWGTHESNLPGAEVLRDFGIRALEWLWHNYWNKEEQQTNVISEWNRGEIAEGVLVATFQAEEDRCYQELTEKLAESEDFDQAKRNWDPLITLLSEGISTFPEGFTEYLVNILSSFPDCNSEIFNAKTDSTPLEATSKFKHPSNLMKWTIHLLEIQEKRGNSPCGYIRAAKQCIQHPNTLAWTFVRQLFERKPYVQGELPFNIVQWVMEYSRHEISNVSLPSNVDQIEMEVRQFKEKLEIATEDKSGTREEKGKLVNGWKKFYGEWSARPIGVL